MIDITIDEEFMVSYQDNAKVDYTTRWVEARESAIRP
jgi:hypothetical protein